MTEPACETVTQTSVSEEEPLDELAGLGRLVRLQRERVEKMIREEREQGVRHPSLCKDVQSLAALAKV